MPLGLSIILLLKVIFSKSKKSLFLAVFFLLFFSNGICSALLWKFVEQPWERLRPGNIPEADAILVLSGGGIKSSSKTPEFIEWTDPDRFIAGITLFNNLKSSKLIFTGGFNPFKNDLIPEGKLYKLEALKLGISEESIFVSKPVTNTLEESIAINNLLVNQLKILNPKIILVTSALHMNRAEKLFNEKNINVIPYPVDFYSEIINRDFFYNPLNWIPDSKNLASSSIALRELLGRVIYNLKIIK